MTLTFSQAIEKVKEGKRLARTGWNGKDMFIFLVPGSTFNVSRAPLLGIFPEGHQINYVGHIDIKLVDGRICVWVPSQLDIMTDDWIEV